MANTNQTQTVEDPFDAAIEVYRGMKDSEDLKGDILNMQTVLGRGTAITLAARLEEEEAKLGPKSDPADVLGLRVGIMQQVRGSLQMHQGLPAAQKELERGTDSLFIPDLSKPYKSLMELSEIAGKNYWNQHFQSKE